MESAMFSIIELIRVILALLTAVGIGITALASVITAVAVVVLCILTVVSKKKSNVECKCVDCCENTEENK